jgi:hypothetical protein
MYVIMTPTPVVSEIRLFHISIRVFSALKLRHLPDYPKLAFMVIVGPRASSYDPVSTIDCNQNSTLEIISVIRAGLAMGCTVGVRFLAELRFFSLPHCADRRLVPAFLLSLEVPGAFCIEVKLLGREADHSPLVVRVPGYRSRSPGSIHGATRFSEKWWVWNGVTQSRVRSRNRDYGRGDPPQ